MDYSSTAIVEHIILYAFSKDKIKKIKKFYACTQRHQYLAYESQQW